MAKESTVQRLVVRARGGDREAFDELTNRFRSRLRDAIERWSRFRVAPRLDVEDVLQETSLRAYRSLDRFRCSEEDDAECFFGWLCGIAKHALADQFRAYANRETPVSSIERAGSGPSPSHVVRRHERLDRLQEALDKLPADYRQVLVLSRLEGLSAHEIAGRMGRTPNAIYHLIVRALHLLRKHFGDTESLHLPGHPLRQKEGEEGD